MEYGKMSKMEKGLVHLLRHDSLQDKEMKAIEKHMISLAKATLKGVTNLRHDIDTNAERHHSENILVYFVMQ